jgi:hypothetical protein
LSVTARVASLSHQHWAVQRLLTMRDLHPIGVFDKRQIPIIFQWFDLHQRTAGAASP